MSLTGIEGNSFSGKSELAKGLINYGYSIINESSYYVDAFPPVPYDLNSAKENLDFFAEVEKRRSEDALKELQKRKKVIMDRTLWTYMLYEYVLFKRFPQRPNAYQYSLDLFQRLSSDGDIVVPKILLCLTPGNETVLNQRIIQRKPTSIDFLNEWGTTELIDSVLEKIVGIYGPENACKLINDKTSNELIDSGVKFLEDSFPEELDINTIFETLRDLAGVK